jgi:hypothetical protein
VVAVLAAKPAVVGTPVLVAKPAVFGTEVQDAIEVAGTGAIEVGELDVAGAAATDAETPEASAAVADESPGQGDFVVAQGGPVIGPVAVEVVAGPVESRAGLGAAGVELGAFQVVRGGSAAGLDGFRVGLGERAEQRGDCPDESWGSRVDLDDCQAGRVG